MDKLKAIMMVKSQTEAYELNDHFDIDTFVKDDRLHIVYIYDDPYDVNALTDDYLDAEIALFKESVRELYEMN